MTAPDTDAPAPDRPASSDRHTAGGRQRRWLLIGLCVAGLLLLVAAAVLALQLRSYAQEDDRRADALAAARQSALNLTSIDRENFEQDVQRVIDGATGAFRTDFEKRSEQLASVLEENEVSSEGKVIEAGLVRSDDRSATALVVVDSNVRNTAAPEGRVNTYRMRLQLERVGDRWLTSMLEFVG